MQVIPFTIVDYGVIELVLANIIYDQRMFFMATRATFDTVFASDLLINIFGLGNRKFKKDESCGDTEISHNKVLV